MGNMNRQYREIIHSNRTTFIVGQFAECILCVFRSEEGCILGPSSDLLETDREISPRTTITSSFIFETSRNESLISQNPNNTKPITLTALNTEFLYHLSPFRSGRESPVTTI